MSASIPPLVPDWDHLLSLQETFDIVWRKAHEMTDRCVNPVDGKCEYRHCGNACFIGWCIPDRMLEDPNLNLPIWKPGMAAIRYAVWGPAIDALVLRELQECHDLSCAHLGDRPMDDSIRRLRLFADKYSLTVPRLTRDRVIPEVP